MDRAWQWEGVYGWDPGGLMVHSTDFGLERVHCYVAASS